MQRFCRFLFFINCWFLPILAGESPTDFQDLGQTRIRGELQNLKSDPEARMSFLKLHGLTDVVEWYWLDRIQEKSYSRLPQDLVAGAYEVRRILTEQPHRLDISYQNLSQWMTVASTKPFQFFSFLNNFLNAPLIALLAALILFSLVQLILWTPAIVRDLQRIFKARGASSFFVSIILVAILAWVLNAMTAYIFLLVLFCVVYSSEKKSFVIGAVLFCLGFNLVPFERAFFKTAVEIEVLEALEQGRTRIEYDPQALQKLAWEEKALWAVRNGAESEARENLLKAPPNTFMADILSTQLDSNPTNLIQTKNQLLQLRTKHGDKPVLLYNLLQVDTQLQNLVAADEWRTLLSESDLRHFNRRMQNWDRLLLPYPTDLWTRAYASFLPNFRDQIPSGWDWFLRLIAPWILFGLAYFFSFRSSGICIFTGHATTLSREKTTRLAQLYQERAEGMEPQARNRYIQEVRSFERKQRALISISSWVFPSAAWVFDGRFFFAVSLSFLPYLLLYWSLSTEIQQILLKGLGVSLPVGNLPTGFSLSLFLLALLVFVSVRQAGKRKLDA